MIAPSPPVAARAKRQASSFASLPELTSITVSRPEPAGISDTSRSASSISGTLRQRGAEHRVAAAGKLRRRHRRPRRAELARDLVVADPVEQLEQSPAVVVP